MKNYELYHHGILGQKWGVRRFQNEDGTLTAAGKRRYETKEQRKIDKEKKQLVKKIKRDFRKDIYDPSYIQKAMDENPKIKRDVEEYSSLKKKYDEHVNKQAREVEKASSRYRDEIDKIMKELGYNDPNDRSYEFAKWEIAEDYVKTHDELYKTFLKEWDKMGAEVYKKGEKVCADILGKYGNNRLTNMIKQNMDRNFADLPEHLRNI